MRNMVVLLENLGIIEFLKFYFTRLVDCALQT